MIVRANENFKRFRRIPNELDHIPEDGEAFEVSEDRFKVLNGENDLGVKFIDAMPEIEKKGKPDNKISIIIPNHNYGHLLKRCFESVLNQTYKNFEIIFVDDCSTDESVKIAKSILKKHKVIELKQRRYNGGARNEGFLYATGDYIWCIDSDDYLPDKECLAKINAKLEYAPDVLFVGLYTKPKNGNMIMNLPVYRDRYDACRGWSGSCGKVIKKDLITKCLYNEGTLKEDRNQHYRVCFYMSNFLNLAEPVYVWDRTNPISVTTKRSEKWKCDTYRHYADCKEFWLEARGKDEKFDLIVESRLREIEHELDRGGDRQL